MDHPEYLPHSLVGLIPDRETEVSPRLRTEEQVAALIRSGTGYLSSGEVARLYRVDAKTVSRWADKHQIEFEKKKPGTHTHKRYPAGQFWEVLDGIESRTYA